MESVDRSQRQKLVLRGAGAAAVATTVAATAHTVSGGEAPPVWLLIAVTLLAMPIAVALTGRRPSLWRTSAVVAVSQFLLHVAFATVGTAVPGAIGHVHGAAPILAGVDAAAFTIDPAMVAGHVIAAALTVALVRHGERALGAVATGLRQLVRRTVVAPQRAIPRLRLVPLASTVVIAGTVALTSLSRRGPPVPSH